MTRTSSTWLALAVGILGGLGVVVIVVILGSQPGGPSPSATATARASVVPSASAVAIDSAAPTLSPTATAPGSVVVVAAGDIASCTSDGDEATAKLLDIIAGTVVTLGDSVYDNGTTSEFRNCYDPTWGRYVDRTRPTPGNHDYHTPNAAPYYAYFGASAGDPATGYYAYDLGAWRIYSLNSNCGEIGGCDGGSAQVAWLKADLAAHPAQCTLAYWHHPRYSSGQHGSEPLVDGLWDTLYDAGAEIVLNGHEHSYERLAPLSDGGRVDPDAGIVEFIVGTGGFNHYEFPNVLAASRVRNNTAFGVLELTLASDSWSARFVPIAGRTFTDVAAGSCH